MEDVGICIYDHLVYFTAIWYILRLFGIFFGHLVYVGMYFMVIRYIFPFWSTVPRKIWQPCSRTFQEPRPTFSSFEKYYFIPSFAAPHGTHSTARARARTRDQCDQIQVWLENDPKASQRSAKI
jgi:hypothetical protein